MELMGTVMNSHDMLDIVLNFVGPRQLGQLTSQQPMVYPLCLTSWEHKICNTHEILTQF